MPFPQEAAKGMCPKNTDRAVTPCRGREGEYQGVRSSGLIDMQQAQTANSSDCSGKIEGPGKGVSRIFL